MWNEPSASGRSHLEAEARPQHRRRHTDAHGDKDERRDKARGRSHRAARACRGTRVQKIKPKSRLYIGSDLVSFEILRNSIQRRRCAAVGWYADLGGDGSGRGFSTGVMGSARPIPIAEAPTMPRLRPAAAGQRWEPAMQGRV